MAKSLINEPAFKQRHRRNETDFTRSRKLPFAIVLLFILQKSLKSLQLSLNEFFTKLTNLALTVTDSALTQARRKLKYTAFIELNQKAIVDPYYGDGDFRTFLGFRILAIDGSKVILPNTAGIREHFGYKAFTNGLDNTIIGRYACATASVLYDVLNDIALDSHLARNDAYEVDLAIAHLEHTVSTDLLILDRNYPSYRFVSTLIEKNRDFVIRCGNPFRVRRPLSSKPVRC